ncbi:MAG: hypothetical protein HQL58_11955 [Magnetococcales bacterium]|nr:hypothetical protein [Magnetococcales bacterium]
MSDQLSIIANGVYFYFHDGKVSPFSLASRSIAQGLRRFGIATYSNIVHPLFITRSIFEPDNLIYLFEIGNHTYDHAYMNNIANYQAKLKFIISMSDNIQAFVTPPSIPALMAHENRFMKIAGWRIPWAFSLSEQTLAALANPTPFEQRQQVILRNFRPSFLQGLRQALDLSFVPWLEQRLPVDRQLSEQEQNPVSYDHGVNEGEHDGRYQNYFDKLNNSMGCLAYGGHFFSNLLIGRSGDTFGQQLNSIFNYYTFTQDPVVLRWDSFRLWESLAAGCLTFHLDFDKYGLMLPVMPVAWQHYIPIDMANPKETVEHLMDERSRWGEIAAAGRQLALTHYSPEGCALRFLQLVRQLHLQQTTPTEENNKA